MKDVDFPSLIPSASHWVSFCKGALAKHKYWTHCQAARVNSVTCMMQFGKEIWCETVRLKGYRGSPRHTVALAVSLSEGTTEQIHAWLLCNISAAQSTSCVSHSLMDWGLQPSPDWDGRHGAEGPSLSHPLHKKKWNRQHKASCQHVLLSTIQIYSVSQLKGDSVSVVTEHLQDRPRQPQSHSFLWYLKLGPGFPCLL